jgi:uncharacterized membrane protein YfcA
MLKLLGMFSAALWGLGGGLFLAHSFFGASNASVSLASLCVVLSSATTVAWSYLQKLEAEKQDA